MTLSNLKLDAWCNVLQKLDEYNTITRVCNNNNMTYSHVSAIIELFIKHKFVSTKQDGRQKIITLTDKGMKTMQLLNKIEEQLK